MAKNADEHRNFVIPLDVDSGFVRGLIGDKDVVKLDASIGKWMKISSDSSPVTWCTIIEAVEKVLIFNYIVKWIIYLNDKLYHKLVLVVLMIKLISEIEY